jgi:ATP-dependent DNA helicase RecG
MFNVMRSSALAEPEIENDTTGFNVILYHRSLYDPNVKLWLSGFDPFKLTESQLAIIALGYAGKEFSTQDIIDRLGIVDIDQLQQAITPLRKHGLLERTNTHAQAYRYAEAHRIPKREVPSYRVVEPSSARPMGTQGDGETELEDTQPSHRLFIANIAYHLTKNGVVTWLSSVCDVQGFELPSGAEYGASNRGFAFATVLYDGDTTSLVEKLDGAMLAGRRVHVKPHRDIGTA